MMNRASQGTCPMRVKILSECVRHRLQCWKGAVTPHARLDQGPVPRQVSVPKHFRTTAKRHIVHHVVS